jgi:hypothetical protein
MRSRIAAALSTTLALLSRFVQADRGEPPPTDALPEEHGVHPAPPEEKTPPVHPADHETQQADHEQDTS